MTVTRWTYAGLALLAVGLLLVGVGGATHVDQQRCQSVQFVSVTNASAANLSTASYETVDYETLSNDEQQLFRAALAENGQVLTKRGAVDEMVVRYRSDSYLVRTSADTDCTPWHPVRVVAPLGGGLGLFLLGVALTRGREPGA